MNEYVIAKYIRLSLDDAVSESLSISNQRALLDRHIDSLEIPNGKVLEFVDNGYTGTNLERPALLEMLDLVQTGKINCILVKDFSRFARNEIESSYYIEQAFPIYKIRFIAVSDNFDSNDYRDGMGGIEVAFKFLMHEQYSLDLSKKIKSARLIKMKKGENIVANAIYGYRKNMATGKWELDAEAAEIVKLIYRMALENTPVTQIRDFLSAAKYPTPREYANLKRGKDILPEYAWETRAVNNILENEQYTGTYISGKYEKKVVGAKNHILTDKSEWIKIPDSHPFIISKEDFSSVQLIINRIKGARVERPIERLLDNKNYTNRSRMENGKITTTTPPFGYIRGNGEQWELIEPAASRVREIFNMALQGYSCVEISQQLHEAQYPTPREHIELIWKREISPKCRWTEATVRKLLKNIQYTGAYVSGKVCSDYETGKKHKMRECDWIVVPGKNPAIITVDVYEQVQNLIRFGRVRRKNTQSRDLIFNGKILKCGCCGYALRYSCSSKNPTYRCVHTLALTDALCYKMNVNASQLENAILTAIKKQAEAVIGSDDLTQFQKPNIDNRKIADYENLIKKISEQRQNCYERFMCGEIDRDTFIAMKNEYTAQIEEINTQAALLRQIGRDKEAKKGIITYTKEVMNETATPKDIVNALVDKIFVFPDKRLEIHWKFEDFTKP